METSDINVSRPRGKIVDYDDDSESEDEIVVKSRNQEQGQSQVQAADVGTYYVRDIVQEIVTNIGKGSYEIKILSYTSTQLN